MCLAIPGCVVELHRSDVFASAVVEFAGVRREVNIALIPDVSLGEYVLVHAGVALSKIDPDEAARILAQWSEIEDGEGP